jgi:hypothetical protein
MKLRDLHQELGELLADSDTGRGDYAVCATDRDSDAVDCFHVDMVVGTKILSLYDEDTDSYVPMVALLTE